VSKIGCSLDDAAKVGRSPSSVLTQAKRMFQAKLLIVGGGEGLREVDLDRLPMTMGRSEETDICLPHALVSRSHCEIYEEDDLLCVRDLGSLNGTFVGNQQVQQSVLKPGELLTVGTVTFRAVYGGVSHDDQPMGSMEDTASAISTARIGDLANSTDQTETLHRTEDTIPSTSDPRLH